MKKKISLFLAAAMMLTAFCRLHSLRRNNSDTDSRGNPTQPAAQKDVDLVFFTGKVETVDLLDEIIADYNAQSNGITVEQEYQNDASNIIKIKFASGEAPAVMTTYEQEYVNQGKYLDLSDWNEIWDRLIPSMRENCTDVNSRKTVSNLHQHDYGRILV